MEPQDYSLDDVEQVDEKANDTPDAEQSDISPKGNSGLSLGLSKRQMLVIALVVVVVAVVVARQRRGGSSSSDTTDEEPEAEPSSEPIHIPEDADQSAKDAAALEALKAGGHTKTGAGE